MDSPTAAAESPRSPRVKAVVALVFAIFGALAPLFVVYYEHRVRFLPIRTIEFLWPSSLIFLPDPARRFPIVLNTISLALNALIYAIPGFLLGALFDFLRSRTSKLPHG